MLDLCHAERISRRAANVNARVPTSSRVPILDDATAAAHGPHLAAIVRELVNLWIDTDWAAVPQVMQERLAVAEKTLRNAALEVRDA